MDDTETKVVNSLCEQLQTLEIDNAELRERVESLKGALQELREYSKPHGGESPGEAGLQDIVYEVADAALSQAKPEHQAESGE